MRKSITFMTVFALSACATVRPCVTTAPPKLAQLECAVIGQQENMTGLACTNDSIAKFVTSIDETQTWDKNTWASCGPKSGAKTKK